MDDEVAIKVEHVSKKYCKSLKRTMLYGMSDIMRNSVGLRTHSDKLRKSEFWAVDDVSFEVKKGETLGIIGPNGSGKTTMLKMLNGIFWPDKGKITIKGRVGALIAVGAGFHPMLTGRENIYVNAAILGMTKKEVDAKFDDIIEFADIGDFLDTPVKFYSSGMYIRLGFAVAVHCELDILLVDEILSVGDRKFQNKSMKRMKEMISTGSKSIVFVSHNLGAVNSLCKRVIWLDKGRFHTEGPSTRVISEYEQQVDLGLRTEDAEKLSQIDPWGQGGVVNITDVKLLDENMQPTQTVEFMKFLRIRAWYEAKERIDQPNFRFDISDSEGNALLVPSSEYQCNLIESIGPGKGYVDCIIEKMPLMPGSYYMRGVYITSPDFLLYHTRTHPYIPFVVTRPKEKCDGVPSFILGDAKVWIPARIEYGSLK